MDREMEKPSCALVLAAMSIALAADTLPAAPESKASSGKALFIEKKCNVCHSASSASIPATSEQWKKKDLDLTKSARKNPGFTADLAGYLARKTKREGRAHLVPFKGSEEQIEALVTWLGSLGK